MPVNTCRREFLASGIVLLGGCIGSSDDEPQEGDISADEEDEEDALPDYCNPDARHEFEEMEDPEERAEYAARLYGQAYEELTEIEKDFGLLMNDGDYMVQKETGTAANVPGGPVVEELEDEDGIRTIITYGGSALEEYAAGTMFSRSIDSFETVQEDLDRNIEGHPAMSIRSEPGWEDVQMYVSDCEIAQSGVFEEPIAAGIEAAEQLQVVADKFIEVAELYLENEVVYRYDLEEAREVELEALEALDKYIELRPPASEEVRENL